MNRKLPLLSLWLILSLPALAQLAPLDGYCEQGGTKALTSGLSSTNYQNGVIPSCTVTVYLTGTTTKATIYADGSSTPLSNPFTATTSSSVAPGYWLFYAASGTYDVKQSGGIAPNVYASPVTVKRALGGGGGSGCTPEGPLYAVQSQNPLTDCYGDANLLWYPSPLGTNEGSELYLGGDGTDTTDLVVQGSTSSQNSIHVTGDYVYAVNNTAEDAVSGVASNEFNTGFTGTGVSGIGQDYNGAGTFGVEGYAQCGFGATLPCGPLYDFHANAIPANHGSAQYGFEIDNVNGTALHIVDQAGHSSIVQEGTSDVNQFNGYVKLGTGVTPGTSPVCPNGSGGALTTTGCTTGSAGITALTGDGTATGPGSAALTLATVNSSPGTCGDATHVCQITTNGKGLTTAQTAVAITAGAVSSVSNSDSTLTVSPTTGAVVASLNLGHANTFTATQTFPNIVTPMLHSGSSSNTDLTGRIALSSGSASYSLTGTYASAPDCHADDVTNSGFGVVVSESTTTVSFTGNGTDTIKYFCSGRN